MQRRICWKKGMRLSDNIMKASDDAIAEWVANAMVLAAAGRFGLFPGPRPFQISLGIGNNYVEVVSLDCLAVTKSGRVIDLQFDSKFTGFTYCRIPIPTDAHNGELFLTVGIQPDMWVETLDGYEEPNYVFNLLKGNTPINNDEVPIARLVNTDFGEWRIDDSDFVPPCLFVSSHPTYVSLHTQFLQILGDIDNKSHGLLRSDAKEAVKIYWPVAQQILIDTDKGRDLLTPMDLLGNIQKFVCAFTTACEIDEYLNLSDAMIFRDYAMSPYNYKDVYQKIREGIGFCFSINEKLGKIQEAPVKPSVKVIAPMINDDQLFQNCKSLQANIPVINKTPGASIFYSIDGSEPSQKLMNNGILTVDNGFNKKKLPEPDKVVVIKLKAVADGISSEVVTCSVTLHKDYKVWDGYEI